MGLDSVELVMAVEEDFGIEIANEEAEKILTVGDLHKLINSKLEERIKREPDVPKQELTRCLSSMAFYRIRRAIVEILGVKRREINPSTPLESLFPKGSRRERWRGVKESLKLNFPELKHPDWVGISVLLLAILLTMEFGFYFKTNDKSLVILFIMGMVLGCVMASMTIKYTPALATVFPRNETTVGDLANHVMQVNFGQLIEEAGSSNKKDTWEALCKIIVEHTGVVRTKITPDASFVDDLGID